MLSKLANNYHFSRTDQQWLELQTTYHEIRVRFPIIPWKFSFEREIPREQYLSSLLISIWHPIFIYYHSHPRNRVTALYGHTLVTTWKGGRSTKSKQMHGNIRGGEIEKTFL
jgi:hypothetical protein